MACPSGPAAPQLSDLPLLPLPSLLISSDSWGSLRRSTCPRTWCLQQSKYSISSCILFFCKYKIFYLVPEFDQKVPSKEESFSRYILGSSSPPDKANFLLTDIHNSTIRSQRSTCKYDLCSDHFIQIFSGETHLIVRNSLHMAYSHMFHYLFPNLPATASEEDWLPRLIFHIGRIFCCFKDSWLWVEGKILDERVLFVERWVSISPAGSFKGPTAGKVRLPRLDRDLDG